MGQANQWSLDDAIYEYAVIRHDLKQMLTPRVQTPRPPPNPADWQATWGGKWKKQGKWNQDGGSKNDGGGKGKYGKGGKPDQLMIDATHLKAHRTAASLLKKGLFRDVLGAPRAA